MLTPAGNEPPTWCSKPNGTNAADLYDVEGFALCALPIDQSMETHMMTLSLEQLAAVGGGDGEAQQRGCTVGSKIGAGIGAAAGVGVSYASGSNPLVGTVTTAVGAMFGSFSGCMLGGTFNDAYQVLRGNRR
jgi:hypothetical protein